MDSQSSCLKFAVIGHQDSWSRIVKFVNMLRTSKNNIPLSAEKIKEGYPFFAPAKLFDIQITSPLSGIIEGFYVETFISPDELDRVHLWQNIKKVKAACEKASILGANVVSLGGFTSIVLETGAENISYLKKTAFTTGNTLTAAFIAQAVQKAASTFNKPLSESNLLIIGSTGDIGSACTNYFSGCVRTMLLTARQSGPLKKQESDLKKEGLPVICSLVVDELLPLADIVICVASSMLPNRYIDLLPGHAIICDAGYPKNIQPVVQMNNIKYFWGGMGFVKSGYQFRPGYYNNTIYDFPIPNISHGCLLESVVLAMENKAIPYSSGRGNISKAGMEEMLAMAARHEITTAPLFNIYGTLC